MAMVTKWCSIFIIASDSHGAAVPDASAEHIFFFVNPDLMSAKMPGKSYGSGKEMLIFQLCKRCKALALSTGFKDRSKSLRGRFTIGVLTLLKLTLVAAVYSYAIRVDDYNARLFVLLIATFLLFAIFGIGRNSIAWTGFFCGVAA